MFEENKISTSVQNDGNDNDVLTPKCKKKHSENKSSEQYLMILSPLVT